MPVCRVLGLAIGKIAVYVSVLSLFKTLTVKEQGDNLRAKGMIDCSWFVLDKIKSLAVGMLHLRLFEDWSLGRYKL